MKETELSFHSLSPESTKKICILHTFFPFIHPLTSQKVSGSHTISLWPQHNPALDAQPLSNILCPRAVMLKLWSLYPHYTLKTIKGRSHKAFVYIGCIYHINHIRNENQYSLKYSYTNLKITT